MFDIFKPFKKEYPKFWNDYLGKFSVQSNRYVVLNIETSGNRLGKDVILYISTFAIENDTILIGDSFDTILMQYIYNHDNGISNDYIIQSQKLKLKETDAIEKLVEIIGNSVLVGFHVNFAIDMINIVLDKMHCGKLKNEALDVGIMYQKWKEDLEHRFSLEEMCNTFKIPQHDEDSCTEDAYKVALLFLKLKPKLGI